MGSARRIFLLVAALLGGATGTAQAGVVSAPGDAGTLLIGVGGYGEFDPDTGSAAINSSLSHALDPTYGPDGRTIAFVDDRNDQLTVRRSSGRSAVLADEGSHRAGFVPHYAYIGDVSFSPDGQRLAVLAGETFDDAGIVIFDIGELSDFAADPLSVPNPDPPRTLLNIPASSSHLPREILWDHASGDLVTLWASDDSQSDQIRAIDPDTAATRTLTTGRSLASLSIGPDGTIYYASEPVSFTVESGTVVTRHDLNWLSLPGGVIVDNPERVTRGNCDADDSCPEATWTSGITPGPDGRFLVVYANFTNEGPHGRVTRTFDLQTSPTGGRQRTIFGPTDIFPIVFGWAQAPPPVIYLPGFLGSRMTCDGTLDGDELWPRIPLPPRTAALTLAADGRTNAGLDGCPGTAPAGIVESVAGKDIYGGAAAAMQRLAGADGSIYAWDWRKPPSAAVAELDAYIDDVLLTSQAHHVVLVGHSMGGLLAREYVSDPARRAKVARVATLGTPYWGSPKSFFPLLAGIESPAGVLGMDSFFDNDGLQAMARTLSGLYTLYPSARFGTWLSRPGGALDAAGIDAKVADLGGVPALLDQAQADHASTFDGFGGIGELPWEVFAGDGLPTVRHITMRESEARVELLVGAGDETVPSRSAMLGTDDDGTTPDAARPVHRVCGVSHVPLGADPGTLRRLFPYLLTGAPVDVGDDVASCPDEGWLIEVRDIDPFFAARRAGDARRAPGDPLTLDEAELENGLTVLQFDGSAFVLVPGDRSLSLRLDDPDARVTITELVGEQTGTVTRFGPLGQSRTLTLAPGADPVIAGLQPATGGDPTPGGGPTAGGGGGGGGGGGSTPSTAPATPAPPATESPSGSPTPAGGPTAPTPGATAADRTAPRTRVVVQRLRHGRVRVTLRARDAGSGVRSISYRLGARGPARRYRGAFVLTRGQLRTLRVSATDRAGNVERLHPR